VHRSARAAHRDVKLRLVRLAERLNRHADDDLCYGFTLAGVASDNNSLVQVQSAAGPNLSRVERHFTGLNRSHHVQLVVAKLGSASSEVFRDSDRVTD
jgi:hypothetical protein